MMPILSVGGASRLMSEIVPLMNEQDEATFIINKVVNNSFLHYFDDAGVKVISLNCHSLYNPIIIIRLARHLKHYDIIHAHLFPSLYWVAIANFFIGKPLVYTEHNTYNKRRSKSVLRPIERWIYSRYKKIISISDLTQKNLKDWLNIKDENNRFVVVNNGVNLSEFRGCKHERIYPHALIMVARFAPAKDQATIIRAMGLLDNDVHLILVGDGDNKINCEEIAKEMGVANRVHFTGTQSDVAGWIGKADIGIQSSKWEGFGLTAVEMMAGGLPVVASDVDGLRQVVEGAGILFPCGDHVKLAQVISKLFSEKDYYDQVKQKCLARSEEYDIKKMVKAYFNVYKDILNKNLER